MINIVRICNEIHPFSGLEGCPLAEMIFQHYILLDKSKEFRFIIFSRPFSNDMLKRHSTKDNFEILRFALNDKHWYGDLVKDKSIIKRLKRDVHFVDFGFIERICYFFVKKSFFKRFFYSILSVIYHVKVSRILKEISVGDMIVHLYNRPISFLFKNPKGKYRSVLEMQNSHLVVNNWFIQGIMNRLVRGFDRLVFVSKFLENEYGSKNRKSCKSSIAYNGLSLVHQNLFVNRDLLVSPETRISRWKSQFFKLDSVKADNVIRVLFTGRIVKQKGLHSLLDSLKKVVMDEDVIGLLDNNNSHIELKIVGAPLFGKKSKSDYLNMITNKVSEFNSNHLKLEFEGFKDKVDLSLEYITSDILVVPSLWDEPFGIVNIEGMFFYNVVIASRGGGIPEIISDKKDGYLFEKGNLSELAVTLKRAVKGILSNDASLKGLVRNANKRVSDKFLMQNHLDSLLKVYKELL